MQSAFKSSISPTVTCELTDDESQRVGLAPLLRNRRELSGLEVLLTAALLKLPVASFLPFSCWTLNTQHSTLSH